MYGEGHGFSAGQTHTNLTQDRELSNDASYMMDAPYQARSIDARNTNLVTNVSHCLRLNGLIVCLIVTAFSTLHLTIPMSEYFAVDKPPTTLPTDHTTISPLPTALSDHLKTSPTDHLTTSPTEHLITSLYGHMLN